MNKVSYGRSWRLFTGCKELRGRRGLYCIEDAETGDLLYVGSSRDLGARIHKHLGIGLGFGRVYSVLTGHRVRVWYEVGVDAFFAELEVIRNFNPRFNIAHRMPDDKTLWDNCDTAEPEC